MRAAIVDQRLEAVAGTPVVDVTRPTNRPTSPPYGPPVTGTILAVGRYIHDPGENEALGQALLQSRDDELGLPDRHFYVKDQIPRAFRLAEGGGGSGTLPGGIFWAHVPGGGHRTWGLGSHQNGQSHYQWAGPMRGLIFPRILTQSEVQAVISRIAGIL